MSVAYMQLECTNPTGFVAPYDPVVFDLYSGQGFNYYFETGTLTTTEAGVYKSTGGSPSNSRTPMSQISCLSGTA